MWLLLAFLSATLLGFYDVFKKKALKDNAVLPVLFFNTLFSSLIFLPFILLSAFAPGVLGGTMLDLPVVGWEVHKFIITIKLDEVTFTSHIINESLAIFSSSVK